MGWPCQWLVRWQDPLLSEHS
uniref:Chalcone synthase n=1 Tax=Rhizophora mucronata TaxID=61149 RepID=A0A2P2ILX1_RHIMU